jgi:hypothetical protein
VKRSEIGDCHCHQPITLLNKNHNILISYYVYSYNPYYCSLIYIRLLPLLLLLYMCIITIYPWCRDCPYGRTWGPCHDKTPLWSLWARRNLLRGDQTHLGFQLEGAPVDKSWKKWKTPKEIIVHIWWWPHPSFWHVFCREIPISWWSILRNIRLVGTHPTWQSAP